MDDNPCGTSEPGSKDGQQDFLHTCCEFFSQGVSHGDPDNLGGWGCDISLRPLIEWSADCNDAGVVDYGQILDGTYPDENDNGVPDCCEALEPRSGDLNHNGLMDSADLGLHIAARNTDGNIAGGSDINGDSLADASDLELQISNWGDCGCNWTTNRRSATKSAATDAIFSLADTGLRTTCRSEIAADAAILPSQHA